MSRKSGRGSRGNWVYLGVGVVVTLLVVWSLWGTLNEALSHPSSSCNLPGCVYTDWSTPWPVIAGFFLVLFYVALFLVKRHIDEATETALTAHVGASLGIDLEPAERSRIRAKVVQFHAAHEDAPIRRQDHRH